MKILKSKWFWLLVLIAIIAFFIYKTLFPGGPILDEVPNPVRDRATKNWTELENQIPKNENRELFFGDMHVHTNFSFDAYIGGVVADPGLAYEFAKGKSITVIDKEVAIERPLDFAAITDHSEYFGELYSINTQGAPAHNAFMARYFRSIGFDTLKQRELFYSMLKNVGKQDRKHLGFFKGYETTKSAWDVELDAAEKHYKPGAFTTFAAYEWTSGNGFAHNHRNVFFKDMKVPDYPVSALEAKTEMELWTSLENFREKGATVMAIPHNSNLSEGVAFPLQKPDGSPIDEGYIMQRSKNEPLVEIHQAKGNSEVASAYWATDEYANFENYDSKKHVENDYVRWALKKGLEYQVEYGVNPYRYGFIASTDTHNGTPGNTEEDDDYIGNHSLVDSDPEVRANREWILDIDKKTYEAVNPGGLMAVWAKSNTRSEIYEAMERKETYGTSGGRIKLRVFGGKGFSKSHKDYQTLVEDGYANGNPMGSILNQQFDLLIWAAKDPEGANLEKLQIIKGWYDGTELQEMIYNVTPKAASSQNEGSSEMTVLWSDPDFDDKQFAFYYVRVLEVETPRWSHWDEKKYGVKYPDEVPDFIRERAWSSPIWYDVN